MFSLVMLPLGTAFCETLYVHATNGNDAAAGGAEAPFRTIRKALSRAKAGDTVLILPQQEPIHESILIPNLSGEPGKPITVDGGGNWLSGARPINVEEWEEVAPGIFRTEKFPKLPEPLLRRFYFVIDGKVNRMGRSSKGRKAALPAVEDLKPGQWTYTDEGKVFYIALEKGASLADAKVEALRLSNGLATSGESRHWIIRNVNVKHFINDGFNFHGATKDFVIENGSAVECGDDGMSAHGDCEVEVRGFVARGNSTGICHIDRSSSRNQNVVLEENHGVNLYLLGSGRHDFSNSILSAKGAGIRIGNAKDTALHVTMTDCEIPWPDTPEAVGRGPLTVAPVVKFELLGSTKIPAK